MASLGQAEAPSHLGPTLFLASHVAVTGVTPGQIAWLIRGDQQMLHALQGLRKEADRPGRPESAGTGLGSGGH